MSKKKNKNEVNLLTSTDFDDVFNGFDNDKKRMRYMKDNYGQYDIADAFAKFYNLNISRDLKKDDKVNKPVTIELGKIYSGTVEHIGKDGITFTLPGVKDEVYSKENFADCIDNVHNYLLNHNNELLFKVIDRKDGNYVVSVMDGYYSSWVEQIEDAIEKRAAIWVHIDELVRGGYMCHTDIWPINQLTGKNYTAAVFIPGSNIVLNIETDFERWLNQDVQIIPQKFTTFRQPGQPAENSLIGSRKMVLKILGMKNMFDIYQRAQLAKMPGVKYTPEVFEGKVTGIINSNKKTGVFIELEDKYITGLMPVPESMLLNYKPGDDIKVCITEFEQQEGKEAFVIDRKNIIRQCNLRPVFELAV